MDLAQEEVFGPVLGVLTFHDEEELIALANQTRYGLAAGLWTNDMKRTHRVARDLKAGTVWINTYRTISYASPFGGYKHSGYGRELGWEAIREFTHVKRVWVDWPTPYLTPSPCDNRRQAGNRQARYRRQEGYMIPRLRADVRQRCGSDEATPPFDSGSGPGAVYLARLEASISRMKDHAMPAARGECLQRRGAHGGAGEHMTREQTRLGSRP